MLRDPGKRMLSAFYDKRRIDCQLEPKRSACCESCAPDDAAALERLKDILYMNFTKVPRRVGGGGDGAPHPHGMFIRLLNIFDSYEISC